MPKRKRKPSKYERVTRKKKMLYKCVGKTETLQHIHFQEKNKHGALNNITETLPYYNLNFQYFMDPNKLLAPGDEAPMVISANFSIQTRSKEIYDKYQIGEEYKELPINV